MKLLTKYRLQLRYYVGIINIVRFSYTNKKVPDSSTDLH